MDGMLIITLTLGLSHRRKQQAVLEWRLSSIKHEGG